MTSRCRPPSPTARRPFSYAKRFPSVQRDRLTESPLYACATTRSCARITLAGKIGPLNAYSILRPGVGAGAGSNDRLDRFRRPRAASVQCRVPKEFIERPRHRAMENTASNCLCGLVGDSGLTEFEGARCRWALCGPEPGTSSMVRGFGKGKGSGL